MGNIDYSLYVASQSASFASSVFKYKSHAYRLKLADDYLDGNQICEWGIARYAWDNKLTPDSYDTRVVGLSDSTMETIGDAYYKVGPYVRELKMGDVGRVHFWGRKVQGHPLCSRVANGIACNYTEPPTRNGLPDSLKKVIDEDELNSLLRIAHVESVFKGVCGILVEYVWELEDGNVIVDVEDEINPDTTAYKKGRLNFTILEAQKLFPAFDVDGNLKAVGYHYITETVNGIKLRVRTYTDKKIEEFEFDHYSGGEVPMFAKANEGRKVYTRDHKVGRIPIAFLRDVPEHYDFYGEGLYKVLIPQNLLLNIRKAWMQMLLMSGSQPITVLRNCSAGLAQKFSLEPDVVNEIVDKMPTMPSQVQRISAEGDMAAVKQSIDDVYKETAQLVGLPAEMLVAPSGMSNSSQAVIANREAQYIHHKNNIPILKKFEKDLFNIAYRVLKARRNASLPDLEIDPDTRFPRWPKAGETQNISIWLQRIQLGLATRKEFYMECLGYSESEADEKVKELDAERKALAGQTLQEQTDVAKAQVEVQGEAQKLSGEMPDKSNTKPAALVQGGNPAGKKKE